MAINIGSNILFQGKDFLDSRQQAKNKSELLNWVNIVPNGFEVCCNGLWYVYLPEEPQSDETGYFHLRDSKTSTSIDNIISDNESIKSDISDIKGDIESIQDNISEIKDSTISEIQEDLEKISDDLSITIDEKVDPLIKDVSTFKKKYEKEVGEIDETLNLHIDNDDIHVTSGDKLTWNEKVDVEFIASISSLDGPTTGGVSISCTTWKTDYKDYF